MRLCGQFGVGVLLFGIIAALTLYEIHVGLLSRKNSFKPLTAIDSKKSDPSKFRFRNAERGLIWPKENGEINDRISNQLQFMTNLNQTGKMKTGKPKLIYQVPHKNYGRPLPEGHQLFTRAECPVQVCKITRDLKKADAVLLYAFRPSMTNKMLPKPKNQIWIMTGGESPPVTSHILDSRALRDLVNWTLIYRRDATIASPWEKFETFPNFTRIDDYRLADGVNYAAGKRKKVGWMVSNCNYSMNSGRGNYVNELSKFIDVDIYGRCGNLSGPKDVIPLCLEILREDYKFYLAFENNCCRGYITEKFFRNALNNDVIPIVLGAHPDDYKALAPPGSYIHVDDFESPKQLADYLHILDKNDTLYSEYFRWKKTGKFISTMPICRLCALLHANDDGSYVHWYPDFHKWWAEGVCLKHPNPGQWPSWKKMEITIKCI